jgi:proton-coupled amino acid transporter
MNLVFSFPLVIHPAHTIVESYFYKNWEKSNKRWWSENLTRSIVVSMIVGLTVILGNKLDKFISVLGALTCMPIAFTFPALFHYKLCASSM